MAIDVLALRRAHYNATVVEARRVRDDRVILRIRPDAPIPPYEAGQWIAIGLGLWEPRIAAPADGEPVPGQPADILRRPFSISSPILAPDGTRLLQPEEEDFYELYAAMPPAAPSPSPFLARLFALVPGARLWVDERPRGTNTLAPVRPADDVLFAATGTGEAPHNRMIWELLRRGHGGRIASIVTTRHRADQVYRETHERLARLFPSYRHAAIATRGAGEPGARLQDLLRSGRLEVLAGFRLEPGRARVFLCGYAAMIGAPRLEAGERIYPPGPGMVELLECERGLGAEAPDGGADIHFERY